MAAMPVCLNFVVGPIQMLKLYGIPYWVPDAIFVMWLDFVTYLHHHGHEDKLPWYRGKEWSYLRGGLTTLDRDYGWTNQSRHLLTGFSCSLKAGESRWCKERVKQKRSYCRDEYNRSSR
ncbi:unnamed protein product [Eruca vesicaria subsp. sativa]|uniref:Uncharacterized protein n=1 Tax=Eruca vesicaria subsp. sativa TaxID=29727 RepID=A0ABC8J5B5_ERUVS|nr:unnamed protein product [Eruca vesicaria subsp. sativa]